MLELQLLPARQGDALWVRWDDGGSTKHMIVDMGTPGTGTQLRNRLLALPEDKRVLELVVVTHIDSDHIGGVLTCLVDKPVPALQINDIWFNGLAHAVLDGALPPKPATPRTESMGAKQAAKLTGWLETQRWNEAFARKRICLDSAPRTIALGELNITVLGPPPDRLAELAPHWRRELVAAMEKEERAKRKRGTLERQGTGVKPRLPDVDALRSLSAAAVGKDKSKPNGSSIVMLLEYRGRRVLLAGDAYAADLVAGIAALGQPAPLRLDAFKLPHHGSRDNITSALVRAVDCPLFLFSTDGTQFKHPDSEAVACVIEHGRGARGTVELGFNERSDYNEWWEGAEWIARFGYTVRYGDDTNGLTVRFDD